MIKYRVSNSELKVCTDLEDHKAIKISLDFLIITDRVNHINLKIWPDFDNCELKETLSERQKIIKCQQRVFISMKQHNTIFIWIITKKTVKNL